MTIFNLLKYINKLDEIGEYKKADSFNNDFIKIAWDYLNEDDKNLHLVSLLEQNVNIADKNTLIEVVKAINENLHRHFTENTNQNLGPMINATPAQRETKWKARMNRIKIFSELIKETDAILQSPENINFQNVRDVLSRSLTFLDTGGKNILSNIVQTKNKQTTHDLNQHFVQNSLEQNREEIDNWFNHFHNVQKIRKTGGNFPSHQNGPKKMHNQFYDQYGTDESQIKYSNSKDVNEIAKSSQEAIAQFIFNKGVSYFAVYESLHKQQGNKISQTISRFELAFNFCKQELDKLAQLFPDGEVLCTDQKTNQIKPINRQYVLNIIRNKLGTMYPTGKVVTEPSKEIYHVLHMAAVKHMIDNMVLPVLDADNPTELETNLQQAKQVIKEKLYHSGLLQFFRPGAEGRRAYGYFQPAQELYEKELDNAIDYELRTLLQSDPDIYKLQSDVGKSTNYQRDYQGVNNGKP